MKCVDNGVIWYFLENCGVCMPISVPADVQKRVDAWLSGPFDERTKSEIRRLQESDPGALIDAFYRDLSFGTGGMRELMGVGTNRLNVYTIRLATQGLANYLKRASKERTLSVVIGFDSRHNSHTFAEEAAHVLAGNGIRVYLLKELRPTPFISFVCREKKASGAIMITASHNPATYNGYKVYWSDGAQVVHPHDSGIVKEVEVLKGFSDVKLAELSDPLIEMTNGSLDLAYLDAIRPLQHFAKENKQKGGSVHIAYTSLHGTGITLAPRALADWGFTAVFPVEKQCIPDGDFPTVSFPNPEYKEALQLGMEKMQKVEADLLIANDPDADRTGIVAMHKQRPVILTGNEIAAICADYLGEVLTEQRKLPPNGAFVTTIVSTELLKAIAKTHRVELVEVLTGFKYIGEKIHEWETSPNGLVFLFGAEESYGYLIGTHARDKDAIVTSCLIAEIALHAKLRGETLVDRLHHIYKNHGVFREKQLSLNFNPGKEGMERMVALMDRLRKKPPTAIGHGEVVYMEDYVEGLRKFTGTSRTEPLTLPSSNVLLFRLKDQSRLVIRPSGTEPKLKIYASVSTRQFASVEEGITSCDARLDLLLQQVKGDLQ